MTDEPLDLAPIEARDAATEDSLLTRGPKTSFADRRALLAEVKRLRTQLAEAHAYAERLRGYARSLYKDYTGTDPTQPN